MKPEISVQLTCNSTKLSTKSQKCYFSRGNVKVTREQILGITDESLYVKATRLCRDLKDAGLNSISFTIGRGKIYLFALQHTILAHTYSVIYTDGNVQTVWEPIRPKMNSITRSFGSKNNSIPEFAPVNSGASLHGEVIDEIDGIKVVLSKNRYSNYISE